MTVQAMVSRNANHQVTEELAALIRIEELVRAIARTALSDALAEIVGDKKLRLLYEEAGRIPRAELSRRTGFSGGKISGLWKKWEARGLMVKDGKSYRPVL